MTPSPPYHGVVWHRKQKAWRVRVKKMDHSVAPSRLREFYREFPQDALDTALRVRDYVARLLHGPNAKLNTDGQLPAGITRINIIQWLVRSHTIHPEEVASFSKRIKILDDKASPR